MENIRALLDIPQRHQRAFSFSHLATARELFHFAGLCRVFEILPMRLRCLPSRHICFQARFRLGQGEYLRQKIPDRLHADLYNRTFYLWKRVRSVRRPFSNFRLRRALLSGALHGSYSEISPNWRLTDRTQNLCVRRDFPEEIGEAYSLALRRVRGLLL